MRTIRLIGFALWLVLPAALSAVFVLWIAAAYFKTDELCDACGTRMTLAKELENNEFYALHEYHCPKCPQRGRLSVNKATGDSDWWEWKPETAGTLDDRKGTKHF